MENCSPRRNEIARPTVSILAAHQETTLTKETRFAQTFESSSRLCSASRFNCTFLHHHKEDRNKNQTRKLKNGWVNHIRGVVVSAFAGKVVRVLPQASVCPINGKEKTKKVTVSLGLKSQLSTCRSRYRIGSHRFLLSSSKGQSSILTRKGGSAQSRHCYATREGFQGMLAESLLYNFAFTKRRRKLSLAVCFRRISFSADLNAATCPLRTARSLRSVSRVTALSYSFGCRFWTCVAI